VSDIVSSIWLCLFIAALIGLIMGWLLNRIKVLELETQVDRLRHDLIQGNRTNAAAIKPEVSLNSLAEIKSENLLLVAAQEESQREIQSLRQRLESEQAALQRVSTELAEQQTGLANLNALLDSRDSTLLERSSLLRSRDESLRNREARINQLELEVATYKSELERLRAQ
jgi:chromosome segregation ATPase